MTFAFAAATLVASAVEPVNVPELMVTKAGTPVKDVATWENVRRAELKAIFCENEYGWRPVERPDTLAFELAEPDKLMMDGKAIRKRVLDWVETEPLSPRHP